MHFHDPVTHPRWQTLCLYVFHSVGHIHSLQSALQCAAGSWGRVCPSTLAHLLLGCRPPPHDSSWLWTAPRAQGPWPGTTWTRANGLSINFSSGIHLSYMFIPESMAGLWLLSDTHYSITEPALPFFQYLKLGWGIILGVFPSMTPRSLMVRHPPGSNKALRRSRTEALDIQDTFTGFDLGPTSSTSVGSFKQ